MEAGLRSEVSGSDFASYGVDTFPRLLQLKISAAGDDGDVAFEVMKDNFADAVIPFLAGGDSVDRKLETFIRIFLRTGFAGFVVDDGHGTVDGSIHAIDSSGNFCRTHLNFKPFFGVQDFRLRKSAGAFEKFLHAKE